MNTQTTSAPLDRDDASSQTGASQGSAWCKGCGRSFTETGSYLANREQIQARCQGRATTHAKTCPEAAVRLADLLRIKEENRLAVEPAPEPAPEATLAETLDDPKWCWNADPSAAPRNHADRAAAVDDIRQDTGSNAIDIPADILGWMFDQAEEVHELTGDGHSAADLARHVASALDALMYGPEYVALKAQEETPAPDAPSSRAGQWATDTDTADEQLEAWWAEIVEDAEMSGDSSKIMVALSRFTRRMSTLAGQGSMQSPPREELLLRVRQIVVDHLDEPEHEIDDLAGDIVVSLPTS